MKRLSNERGQVLPIMALLVVVLVGMIGLAVDAGRLYVARAELHRAVDAAALAGIIELPNVTTAQARATTYMNQNQPDATITFPAAGDNQFRVRGTRNVSFLFMRLLGFDSRDVQATAAAGFGIVPSDTVMEIDATGSMGASPCNSSHNNSGCPIHEAKNAAQGFADFFLGGSGSHPLTKVGYTPYRGCHNPSGTNSGCITNSMLVDLTSTLSSITNAINNTDSLGGTGTNTCLGLFKAQEMFNGPNHQTASNTVKSIVIMADGDNTYNSAAYNSGSPGSPPSACRPTTSPSSSDGDVSTSCSSAQTREKQLDTETKALADTLRAAHIEIYVVAFGVCGTLNSSTPTTSYCSGIGNNDHDNTADQRLLKCIASSTPGTNDHYYSVATASDLPQIFQTIAQTIAFRLIE